MDTLPGRLWEPAIKLDLSVPLPDETKPESPSAFVYATATAVLENEQDYGRIWS